MLQRPSLPTIFSSLALLAGCADSKMRVQQDRDAPRQASPDVATAKPQAAQAADQQGGVNISLPVSIQLVGGCGAILVGLIIVGYGGFVIYRKFQGFRTGFATVVSTIEEAAKSGGPVTVASLKAAIAKGLAQTTEAHRQIQTIVAEKSTNGVPP